MGLNFKAAMTMMFEFMLIACLAAVVPSDLTVFEHQSAGLPRNR